MENLPIQLRNPNSASDSDRQRHRPRISQRTRMAVVAILSSLAPLTLLSSQACGDDFSAGEAGGAGGEGGTNTGNGGNEGGMGGQGNGGNEGGMGGCIPAAEICDGIDNNCNDEIDEDLNPQPCNEQNFGVCTGVVSECKGEKGWECDYGPDFQQGVELSCDNLDNNCNGTTDEGCTEIKAEDCNKIGLFPAIGNDIFLPGSSANNNDCELDKTIMIQTGNHLVVWVRDQGFVNLITNDTFNCNAECSLYLLLPPDNSELLTDKNRTFDNVVDQSLNGSQLTLTHNTICQRHTVSCVKQ